jgi:hypothetical protein
MIDKINIISIVILSVKTLINKFESKTGFVSNNISNNFLEG